MYLDNDASGEASSRICGEHKYLIAGEAWIKES